MKIGFATIGQAPRDDLVPYLVENIDTPVEYAEMGIMDTLSPDEISALNLKDRSQHMVTRLRDGSSATIAHSLAVPRMQTVVSALAEECDIVVILCGADWSEVKANKPVLNLGSLFPHIVRGAAQQVRLGVIRPSEGQIVSTRDQYRDEFMLDAEVVSAFPYDDQAIDRARQAAKELKNWGAEMLWMTCVGMTEEMRAAAQEEFQGPIILARSILARVLSELAA